MPDLLSCQAWCDNSSQTTDEMLVEDDLDVFNSEEANFSTDEIKDTQNENKGIIKWLLDTSASINAETLENSVADEKPCNSTVNIADGKTIVPNGVGMKKIRDNKTGYPIPIKKMHVIPEFAKRILSISTLIDEGYQVSFLKEHVSIKDKSGKEIHCPRDSTSGLYYLHAKEDEHVNAVTKEKEKEPQWKDIEGEVEPETGLDTKPMVAMKMPKTSDINQAHDVCGHKGEALLRKTYKRLDVKLTGVLKSCEGCGFAKAKAKAVSKTTTTKVTKPGERLFLDTTGPFSPTLSGYKFWIQVVDDYTRHGFCEFNKNKKGMGVFIRKLLSKLRAMDMPTKYLRCNNAGEHL
jgi:hypothetical protein